ncbi:MAG: hypothetical protein PUK66_07205 [Bacteroidales bacterium]|uniref:hypothetical protein n=1 Tax=Porphyromonas sp. TaxID=1924944 RepID=UPI0029751A15|nr:hypothetical protein [Porphyromonas sp.]MDD7438599.1 hypothetical protein [Bacteroidales bacterium]MDY3067855.1 hypothetical protein [Porphyromonas sp.]
MAKQALSVSQLLAQKKTTLDLTDEMRLAFGEPEAVGTWIIWGQSGNGKTTFALQLAKALTLNGRVLYNSLEEGTSLSLMNAAERVKLSEVGNKVQFICEDIPSLLERLKKRRSPRIVFIDSLQYTQMTYKSYIEFKEALPNHLLIFVSHARGKQPDERIGLKVKYDAMLKIWVEGYRAHSMGRFLGERGYVDVWSEGAERYWGGQITGGHGSVSEV